MASATVVNIQRNSVNEPWGMKIAGGRDFRMQLQVKKVCLFSVADVTSCVRIILYLPD